MISLSLSTSYSRLVESQNHQQGGSNYRGRGGGRGNRGGYNRGGRGRGNFRGSRVSLIDRNFTFNELNCPSFFSVCLL